jgi:hypothetical protein
MRVGNDSVVVVISRIRGWLVFGPLGHLAAGTLDWIELLARYWWARARGRAL